MNGRLGLPRARWRAAVTIVFLFVVASTLLQLQSSVLDLSTRDKDTITERLNWSDFAYTQYVTNTNYLCNSVMLFESLHRLKSKADCKRPCPYYIVPLQEDLAVFYSAFLAVWFYQAAG
jgi:hypothetical protein